MAHSPYSASMACQRAKTTNLSDHVSEYDTPHHRKARAKLRLEHPLVRLESFTLVSSTTVPKNRQVVPGPGHTALGVYLSESVGVYAGRPRRKRRRRRRERCAARALGGLGHGGREWYGKTEG